MSTTSPSFAPYLLDAHVMTKPTSLHQTFPHYYFSNAKNNLFD
jgi:hypothetical protein